MAACAGDGVAAGVDALDRGLDLALIDQQAAPGMGLQARGGLDQQRVGRAFHAAAVVLHACAGGHHEYVWIRIETRHVAESLGQRHLLRRRDVLITEADHQMFEPRRSPFLLRRVGGIPLDLGADPPDVDGDRRRVLPVLGRVPHLLEELLAEFKGTLFLVSHDRAFLNRVVTSTIAFEGDGEVREYVGGYDDWLQQRQSAGIEPVKAKAMNRAKPKQERPRKLTFKEKRELDELPLRIETLESEIAALHKKIADPEFYRTAGAAVADVNNRLEDIERELATIYDRWQELDALGD